MQTITDVAVIPRDIHFQTESARGNAWLGGDLVATAVFNAMSLTFPEGERLFIDAVRKFRGQLQGKLAEDVRAFIRQEAIHSREHASLNAGLDRSHYPVDWVEESIRRHLAYVRSLGPMRMLGATIALEHFTAMLAEMFEMDADLWARTPDELVRLWRWHAMEETEHKAVAFDVFNAVTRDWSPSKRYWFRARMMAITSVHFTTNLTRYSAALLAADGVGRWQATWRVTRFLFGKPGLFRRLGPRYREWFYRDFHPWNHDNRAKLAQWRQQFDAPPTRQ